MFFIVPLRSLKQKNMKKSIKTPLFLFVLFSLCNNVFGQVINHNNDIWLHYLGKNTIEKKLSLTLEGSLIFANGFDQKQQYFIRPSVDYQFTKQISGSIGYTHHEFFVYGDVPLNRVVTPEDNVWIQGVYSCAKNDFKFTHRLRDESRWVGVATKNEAGDFVITNRDYRNRLRYMYLVNYTLTKKEDKTQLFAFLGDEIFMNIGVKAAKTFVQQNRVIAGLGYNLNPQHQIQISYIHQNLWNVPNTIQENNPTLRISYVTNLDWSKKK